MVTVQALNELSLVVERGESVGIIGRNGSGKSTLMKIISGQSKPTSGAVYASSTPIMLGVNAALVQDLSGDQNVILGCLAMGMSRAEVDEKYNSIVELSGLEKSIHLPMKSYSSGMASRLRFAIAASVDPEILLVDEALNTGDAQFGDRSKLRMDELREQAGCVFLVSHSLDTIKSMCTRVIWLDKGDLIMDGEPKSPSRPIRTSPGTCQRATTFQPPGFSTTPKRTLWPPRSVGGPHVGAEADAGPPRAPERPVAFAQRRFGTVQDLAVP